MDGRNLRDGLFPSGACVDLAEGSNEAREAFIQIDGGSRDSALLTLAQTACSGCVLQLEEYCKPQAEPLAEELWRRGAGLAIVGGEHFSLEIARRPAGVDVPPAFRFNLEHMPDDPQTRLALYRQAVQADQFRALPHAEAVKDAAQAFLERLKTTDKVLFAEASALLSDAEIVKGTQYAISMVFQQREFASTQRQRRAGHVKPHLQYDPDTIQPDIDDPLATLYLQDMVAIRKIGFTHPASLALREGPDFYQAVAREHKLPQISWYTFNKVVEKHYRNLVPSLRLYNARYLRAQEANPDASRTVLHGVATSRSHPDIGKEVAEVKTGDSPAWATDKLVGALIVGRKSSQPEQTLSELGARISKGQELYGPEQDVVTLADITNLARNYRTEETYVAALARFAKNVATLRRDFGDKEHFSDGIIRRISRGRLHDAPQAAQDFQKAMGKLLRHSDGSVSRAKLRDYAVRGIDSFREAKYQYEQQRLHMKFAGRVRRRSGAATAIEPWCVERIVSLYPQSELDTVSENVYTLLNNGVLVHQADLGQGMHDNTYQEDLDKIFGLKKHEYLGFSTALQQFTPAERLAIADHYGLMPLLYGQAPNTLVMERHLGADSLEEYVAHLELPDCANSTEAIPVDRLSQDVAYFKALLRQDDEGELKPIDLMNAHDWHTAIVVVGEKILQLDGSAPGGSREAPDPATRAFIQHVVGATYPPKAREQASGAIQEALASGVLEVIGRDPHDMQLVFSSWLRESTVSYIDRVILAHQMGLDRLLYGRDMGTALQERLGDDFTVFVRRIGMPVISELVGLPSAPEIPTEQPELKEPKPTKSSRQKTHANPVQASEKKENRFEADEEPTELVDLDDEAVLDEIVSSHTRSAFVSEDGVKMYLREIGKIPLLNAAQEVELAKAIEAGLLARRKLDDGTFAPEDEHDLIQRANAGEAARKKMIEANLRFVVSMAKRYHSSKLSLLDLVQEGSIGLMKGIEHFDHTRGLRLSTIAAFHIRSKISRALADTDRTVRLPVPMVQRTNKIAKARASFEVTEGREPTVAELAAILDLSAEQIAEANGAVVTSKPAALTMLLGDGDGAEFGDLIGDANAIDPTEAGVQTAFNTHLNRHLTAFYKTLPPEHHTDAVAFILNNGLDLDPTIISPEFIAKHNIVPGKEYILEEIAEMYGVSRPRMGSRLKRIRAKLEQEFAYLRNTSS